MSSLKMTFSLTSLILIFAFAAMPVMAHNPVGGSGSTFDADHDGKSNANADNPDPAETNHTHRAAPTVTSIELVDVKIGADKAARDKADAVSTVSGTSVTLVDDASFGDSDAVVAITDFTAAATTAGEFRIKITFSEDVYSSAAEAANYGAPLADAALASDLIAASAATTAGITDVAASKAASSVQITALTVTEIVRMDKSSKVFLATVTVPAANLVSVPMDVWIGVDANAVVSKGQFSAGQTTDGRGNAAFSSSTPFTIVKMLDDPGDTTAPTVAITSDAGTGADAGKIVFTLTFSEPLGTGALAKLSLGDITITGGTAMAADLSDPVAGTDDDAGKQIYTLKVTPDDTGDDTVMISLNADSVSDAAGNVLATMDAMGATLESVMATYDKTAPTVSITSAAGTGDDAGKVIFTIDISEMLGTGASALTVADLRVSNAAPLKVADLMMVEGTMAAPLPDGVAMRYTLTVTPTDATMPVTLDLAAGSVADVSGNMVDGQRVAYTPSDPGEDEEDVTPPSATQIGSKDYLVVVPMDHYAAALPSGLTKHTEDDMPNLADFFRTGGTIDVAVTGKTNHQVIITEIMVAEDLGKRGTDAIAKSQWIELYNNTDAHINIADITITFKPGFPAAAAPTDATDRVSNTVSGSGWNLADTFADAVSGQTALVEGTRVVVAGSIFKSLRRVHKDDKKLQEAGTVIQDGWKSGSWKVTADNRVFLAGRIGTPGSENRPTVFSPATFVAPTLTVTFNEIANRSDNANEWIELKGPKDTNLRKYKISIVTAYDKATNTGTETTIYEFPDNDDTKIPAGDLLLLTDQDPVNNEIAADYADKVVTPVRYKVNKQPSVTLAPLPNDGNFLLVLRNKDGKILDVAGHLAGLDDDDPYTLMWPLAANVGAAKPGHISAKNKLAGGNVYKRHRAIQGYLSVKDNGDEPAYEASGFTGIGYDRNVSAANKEHHGTPGYPNNAQIGDGTAATTNVVISEVMYGNGTAGFPQWIEIHNRSDTNGVDLHNWRLYIINHDMNADGSKFAGKLLDEVWLRDLKIPPNQTALVVTRSAPRHTTNLQAPQRIRNLRYDRPLLSSKGFSLRLEAKSNEGDLAKRQAGEEVGNLAAADANNRRADHQAFIEPRWALPAGIDESGVRVSMVRRGDKKNGTVLAMGTEKKAWMSSLEDTRAYGTATYYGRSTDIGSPGHTAGGVVPVSLSKFRPERLDTGEVVVRWITESELNNAGFNILRSETRNGEFTKVHFRAGQGTTTERNVYEWKDKSAKPNVVYYYQIQDVSLDGEVTTLRQSRLKGDISPTGKLTTIWGELKALQ